MKESFRLNIIRLWTQLKLKKVFNLFLWFILAIVVIWIEINFIAALTPIRIAGIIGITVAVGLMLRFTGYQPKDYDEEQK